MKKWLGILSCVLLLSCFIGCEDVQSIEYTDWEELVLHEMLPAPEPAQVEVICDLEEWMTVYVYNMTEEVFKEYVAVCQEEKEFTYDVRDYGDSFFANNEEGYMLSVYYNDNMSRMQIDLGAPRDEEKVDDLGEEIISAPTEEPVEESSENDVKLEKGTQYAYMYDEWNVYVVTVVTEEIIKIENWNKTLSTSKSMKLEYEVGTYKITDEEYGFSWIDEDKLAFKFVVTDKNVKEFKKGKEVCFTISNGDSEQFLGSNYDEKIRTYKYENDDWHMYRAIPMSERFVKIEVWTRASSIGKFVYGYDIGLIDLEAEDTDFEWTDDTQTSFVITMCDSQNKSYWKDEKLTVFDLENVGNKYDDVLAFLGRTNLNTGELRVPKDSFNYKYENYEDVREDLENAGFTNISFNVLYDIVWGITAEGEVDSVSIDGRNTFEQGDIFSSDAAVVITYHMKEKDDPEKIKVPNASSYYKGKDYLEVRQIFADLGFTNIDFVEYAAPERDYIPGEIFEVKISGWGFSAGDAFDATAQVTIGYFEEGEPATNSTYYSTNPYDIAKEGNTGMFSYKSKGGTYDVYWIIDFDEGYVYWFTEGNGEDSCDKVKIVEGTLNDSMTITWHMDGEEWSWYLHFKYVNSPVTLIVNDHSGSAIEFGATDLEEALEVRATKNIKEY